MRTPHDAQGKPLIIFCDLMNVEVKICDKPNTLEQYLDLARYIYPFQVGKSRLEALRHLGQMDSKCYPIFLFLFQLAHFLSGYYETREKYEMVGKSNQACTCFPHNFWSSYENLVQFQSEYSWAHSMVTPVGPPILKIEVRIVTLFNKQFKLFNMHVLLASILGATRNRKLLNIIFQCHFEAIR